MNIFLIGPMGAGKTTVGKILARNLGCNFEDSDRVIEERCGADISWIFDVEGEDGFREREATIIDELTRLNNVIIATGGGAVVLEQNRRNLNSRGTVVYLNTPIDQQVERTAKGQERPILRDGDPKEILTRLHEERDPLYRETADIIVHAENRNSKDLVEDIIRELGL
ncbi:MAG: shikimate kinase AroK [Gammaproteobacteria bacterium AqS3]|nr:shikimate kinase AroK [Gammaproteobacteria bacterium AqS3]